MIDAPTGSRRSALARAVRTRPELAVIVVVGIALLVLAALLPLTMAIDDKADRKRPLFNDVQEMADLQYLHFQRTGAAKAVSLTDGETVRLGDTDFTPAPGISISVTVTTDGYCIRAHNDLGDQVPERCEDGDTNPKL